MQTVVDRGLIIRLCSQSEEISEPEVKVLVKRDTRRSSFSKTSKQQSTAFPAFVKLTPSPPLQWP